MSEHTPGKGIVSACATCGGYQTSAQGCLYHAAARGLLEALEEVFDFNPEKGTVNETVMRARAAIRKARGQ